MREYLCAVIPALQPLVRQFRGASIELVGPSLDVGEHVDDPGQVLKVAAAAVPCRRRVRRSVGAPRRVCDLLSLRRGIRFRVGRFRVGRFRVGRFRVGIDGQVAVRAEVPASRSRTRRDRECGESRCSGSGSAPHWSIGGSSRTPRVVSPSTGPLWHTCGDR